MSTPMAPICVFCRRLRSLDEGCEAFPDGIPEAVLDNERDHRRPIDGDHGLRFSARSPRAEGYAAAVFDEGAR